MEKTEKINLFKRAVDTWGVEAQVDMVFEEIGELSTALAQYKRGRTTSKDVITELADVVIMCEQMATLFGYDEFEKETEYKLDRLKERLQKYGNNSQ